MAERPNVRLTFTHDAMIDLIIQEPTVTSAELAEIFGFSPSWICRIVAADSFKARLEQRRSKLVDPILARSLNDRFRSVAVRSMEVLEQRLQGEDASTQLAVEALEVATKGLGVIGHAAV
jgi:CRISPR/Cas system-associated protein Csm6